MLILFAVACNRPGAPAKPGSTTAAAPFTSAAHSANALPPDAPQLSAMVAQIVSAAHRSGSVIYRVECGPERSLEEKPTFAPSPAVEPMKAALDQVLRSYPAIQWNDSANGVRVLDSRVTGGLLKVRIAEFTVIEDQNSETALAALWRSPEVIRYMAAHDLRLVRSRSRDARRSRGVVVIHMKKATVEQIIERIAASYRNGGSRLWSYRECRRGAETLVEVKIL